MFFHFCFTQPLCYIRESPDQPPQAAHVRATCGNPNLNPKSIPHLNPESTPNLNNCHAPAGSRNPTDLESPHAHVPAFPHQELPKTDLKARTRPRRYTGWKSRPRKTVPASSRSAPRSRGNGRRSKRRRLRTDSRGQGKRGRWTCAEEQASPQRK